MFLSKKLNSQILIETQGEIMISRFKELGNSGEASIKVYYFSRNEAEPAKSPEVIEFGVGV